MSIGAEPMQPSVDRRNRTQDDRERGVLAERRRQLTHVEPPPAIVVPAPVEREGRHNGDGIPGRGEAPHEARLHRRVVVVGIVIGAHNDHAAVEDVRLGADNNGPEAAARADETLPL